jgi:SAM-dependent methyltransferase
MDHDPASIQAAYYAEFASRYDDMHGGPGEHHRALEIISGFINAAGATSILDVGTGTGRAVRLLAERHPDTEVMGIDPSPELMEIAVSQGVPSSALKVGRGEALPFPDQSFDVVCELGVLHHVADPAAVIIEMQRLARRAIFMSDINRFGRGSVPARLIKLGLFKTGLWWPLFEARNGGNRHQVSEGDGVFYSYSLYDNLRLFSEWDSVSMVPLEPQSPAVTRLPHPMLTTTHLLLCALRTFPDEPGDKGISLERHRGS